MEEVCIFRNQELEEILPNLKSLLPVYREGNVDSILEKVRHETMCVDCGPLDFGVELDMSEENPGATDIKNVELLYEALKELPPAIAAKTNMWAYYAHAYFADYVSYRSEVAGQETESTVLKDYFCYPVSGRDARRTLLVNPLSRLWWVGHLLYDKENEDPYHYVKMIRPSEFASFVMLLGSSTAVSNPTIAHGIFDAFKKWMEGKEGREIKRAQLVCCTKYLNRIGAVKMVDMLSQEEICNLLTGKLDRTFPEE